MINIKSKESFIINLIDDSNSSNQHHRKLITVTNMVLFYIYKLIISYLYKYFLEKKISEDDDVTCNDAAASHDGSANDDAAANDDATAHATAAVAPDHH